MKKIIFLFSLLLSIFIYSQANQDSDIINEKVEKLAEFPGGINEFRMKITKFFRVDKVKFDKRTIKTIITFYIEKDGTLSDLKAFGGNQSLNDETIRAISKIKVKWTPAKIKGETVRSKFNFPLSMTQD